MLNFGIETDYTEQGTIETAYEVLKGLGHNCIKYNKQQIEQRFPFKNLPDNYFGIYHDGNAVIDVKIFCNSLVQMNKKYGVQMCSGEKVVGVVSDANGAIVTTEKRVYYGKKLIINAGPYINEIVDKFGFELNIMFWNMPFAYYKIMDNSLEYPMWFQFDKPDEKHSSKLFYGFPPVSFANDGFTRIAIDWASHKFTNIRDRHYVPGVIDIELARSYINSHMRGISSMPVGMATAVHAQLPDNLSILDFMPKQYVPYNENIVVMTGGWAFKFVPLFGKICAELAVEGETSYNITEFAITRKNIIKSEKL